jgi:hypothetical protein
LAFIARRLLNLQRKRALARAPQGGRIVNSRPDACIHNIDKCDGTAIFIIVGHGNHQDRLCSSEMKVLSEFQILILDASAKQNDHWNAGGNLNA